jgi:hypothetical protein
MPRRNPQLVKTVVHPANNRRGRFRRSDLTHVALGILAAGLEIARIEIDPTGKIVVVPRKGNDNEPPEDLTSLV